MYQRDRSAVGRFGKKKIFVCSSSAGLKSGKRNRHLCVKGAARCSPPPLPPERHQDRICKKTIRRRARSLRTRRESGAKKKGKERAHTRAAAGAASTQARALHFPLPFERAQLCIKSSGVRIVCDLRRPVGERL